MTESEPPVRQLAPIAPASYLHWCEASEPTPEDVIVEYPLYSDARIVGDSVPLGPYTLLNPVADNDADPSIAAMYLRVRYVERELILPDLSVTRDEHYHGGQPLDEVAALLSLECGMRVFASHAETRRFTPGGDPLGSPQGWRLGRRPPTIRRSDGRFIVPAATGERNIDTGVRLLRRYQDLQAPDAVALVKAARLFQEALWIVESAPELAWLLLSSAVETAAFHRKRAASAVDALHVAHPRLAERLHEAGGEDLVAEVAEVVVNQTKATAKFVEFLTTFAPQLPEPRPPTWAQLDLSSRRKQQGLYSTIYAYRSNALHSGKPYPAPMCWPPHNCDGPLSERPSGFGAGAANATWRVEDTPVLLNTFVYLVRGALIRWWELMPLQCDEESTRGAPLTR